MSDVRVPFTDIATDGKTKAVALVAAATTLAVSQSLIRTVEGAFITTDAIADEAGVARFPAADCPECP